MKLRDLFRKREKGRANDRKTDANVPAGPPQISRKLEENEQWLRNAFSLCHDVLIEKTAFGPIPTTGLLVYCDGMIDAKLLNEVVLPGLHHGFAQLTDRETDEQQLISSWKVSPLIRTERPDEVVTHVLAGHLAVLINGWNKAFLIDISSPPQRMPQESKIELAIHGPRDSFTEQLSVNVALIRKRLTSCSFCYEQYSIGRRSKTKVGLLYIHDIIRPEILREAKERLAQVDVDALISATELQELLSRPSGALFPLFEYTGRPDYVIASMLKGRFAILVDGNPTAIIAPANLSLLYKSPEDLHSAFYYTFFSRLFRILGLFVSLFLPGLYVAVTTYHQDQIPLTLLATLVMARKGTPIPSPLEALTMLILFELFREAGFRLPSAVGQTLRWWEV